ncbi:MAG TPA: OsmC family protein [Coleofasciculaceae cyanobacterium]|jgi:putative redox protein
MAVTVRSEGMAPYRQTITAGNHTFFSDVTPEKGGQDTAPDPHQLMFGAWGSCTAITLQMYANRKGWPLEAVSVTFNEDRQDNRPLIRKQIELQGNLSPEQVARLEVIAEKCPINQMLLGEKQVESSVILK